ncbi:hypothetical protein CHLNCDRAFT_136829 [Chlorella variabilis]|uniref:Uncharacterized protein n=1 Tax=Chlorella variabilis TaxID=554065 RepID=E1ZL53_CHLVA|nr:hypothetical protein CHLNCDRAFT_136829 [Chlorella variabilis]EFN53600.1 hypothetical protein CHLNCDRAFT_136829 [Chlorella variabilis]|eukprot:XP_005845702.1 hypothetical protein CHLNCDRAFT_136829 [Chlorella variabilis]
MAAAAAAAAASASLASSYAAVQSSLRKQFYGDLVDLRGALLNTMNLAPHRAASLHPKMNLIDSALTMLEETKGSVTSAEMAQLMNMSAKVARAVESWRSRKPPARGGGAGSATAAAVAAAPGGAAAVGAAPRGAASPFAAAELQEAGRAAQVKAEPRSAAGSEREEAGELPSVGSVDRFDCLSKLVSGPPGAARFGSATLLPEIDWEVPEIKPSGNLDALLPSEASEVLMQQQRAVARAAAHNAAHVSSAEAFLAHISAHADNASGGGQHAAGRGGGGGGAHGPSPTAGAAPQGPQAATVGPQPQQYLRGGAAALHDPGSGVGVSAPSVHGALTSPRSAATSTGPRRTPFQQAAAHQEASSNDSGGGGGGGSAGGGGGVSGGGSAAAALFKSPSPAPLAMQQQQHHHHHRHQQLQGSPFAHHQSPFASLTLPQQAQQHAPHGLDAGFGSLLPATSGAGFGSQLLSRQQQQQLYRQQQQQYHDASAMQAGGSMGFGFGNAGSLPLSHGSHGAAASHMSAPSALAGMQQLGLGDGGSLHAQHQQLPHHFQQQQQHVGPGSGRSSPLDAVAAQQQQQQLSGRLSVMQQFPHAALHAGTGGLAQLLGGGAGDGANHAHLAQLMAAQHLPPPQHVDFPPMPHPHPQQQQQLYQQQQLNHQQLLQLQLAEQQGGGQGALYGGHATLSPPSPGLQLPGNVVSSGAQFSGGHHLRSHSRHSGPSMLGGGATSARHHRRTISPFGSAGGGSGEQGMEVSTGSMGSPHTKRKRA